MSDCATPDFLADLAAAADRPVLPLLDHLAACDRCRDDLRALADVRQLLAAADPPPAGFVDRVMAGIDDFAVQTGAPGGAAPPGRWSRARALVEAALPALALGVAVAVVLIAGTGAAAAPAGAGPAAPVTAPLTLGLLTAVGMMLRALVAGTSASREPAPRGTG